MLAPEGGEGPAVSAQVPACAHFEASLDCLTCGACCREAYDSVPVTAEDEVHQHHPELIRRDGDWVDLQRVPSPGMWDPMCRAARRRAVPLPDLRCAPADLPRCRGGPCRLPVRPAARGPQPRPAV